ncbi:MAG: molecular chaperone DnaJ [Candidatus Sulfomarinibacteraceae bacterium]
MQRDWIEKDFYEVLGVAKNASREDIRKAYRKLAQENHPDTNPGDTAAEERFKAVSEAYSVLSDPEKRNEYDEVRRLVDSGAYAGGGAGGFPGGGFPGGGGFGGQRINIEDLFGGAGGFGDLFGGGGGRRGPVKGPDLTTHVRIPFRDAVTGTTRTVRLDGETNCSRCGGSGAEPGTKPSVCPTCGGAGQVTQNQGFFSFAQPCPQCRGSGQVVTVPCTQCRGSGTERRTRDITIRIPAGVEDGAMVRARAKGGPGRAGGPAGDLLVRVGVDKHPIFGRRGDDVTVTVPVTFPEAALGAEIAVPTLDDPVRLKVPAGTPTGKTFRVKGRGVQHERGRDGDLLVTVKVDVPAKLGRKARKALEEWQAEYDTEDPRAGMVDA